MNTAERMIQTMRQRFDFLVTDCYRYMKKHEPEKFKTSCQTCEFRKAEEKNGERCGMELHEELRILSMLRGIGMTDRYQPNRKGTYFMRNTYGRVIFKGGKDDLLQ